MRIHYWNNDALCPGGNFGDKLNTWLWPRLIPDLVNNDDDIVLLGIGTILNNQVDRNRKIRVFGSGAGYGNKPEITGNWKIYCVRGPLTAKILGLDESMAVTDPAVLISQFVNRDDQTRNKYKTAFIPHWQTPLFPWQDACRLAGIHYIDPTQEVDTIIDQIGSSAR